MTYSEMLPEIHTMDKCDFHSQIIQPSVKIENGKMACFESVIIIFTIIVCSCMIIY